VPRRVLLVGRGPADALAVMLDVIGGGVVLAEIGAPAARAQRPAVAGASVADKIAKAVDAAARIGEVRHVIVDEDFTGPEPGRRARVAHVAQDGAGLARFALPGLSPDFIVFSI
jgi:hypothetical protein